MTTMNLSVAGNAACDLPKAATRARVEILDAIRGFAILGIFYINLPSMGAGNKGVGANLDASTVDGFVQKFVDLFLEGTQRGMLQMLFGAGLILLTAKAIQPDGPIRVAGTYLRRNMWLVLFGLLHIFVVRWGYDILHVYGLAALVLFTFRGLSAAAALVLGLTITALMQYVNFGDVPTGTELAGRVEQEAKNAVQLWYGSVKGLGLWTTVAEAFATMLIGVALFKWGVIQGLKSRRFYVVLMVLGYVVGLALRVAALPDISAPAKGPNPSEFGRIVMTLGHIGMINLLWQSQVGKWLLSPFQAAGRTAFTLYAMQSVIGIWILYSSWGPLTTLEFGTAGVMATATLVLAAQVFMANLWLRGFDSGPLEMLWRHLVKLTSH